jgi:hypothetical protein
MGAGKILTLIGGILTLVATYLLTFYGNGPFVLSGIGAWMNIPEMFANPSAWVLSLPEFMAYIIAILIIIFLVTGAIILIGIKVRALGIIGAIFALFGGVYFLLCLFTGLSFLPIEFVAYIDAFGGDAIVEGIFPFHLGLGVSAFTGTVGLGTYVLLGGGILGFIGAILPRD